MMVLDIISLFDNIIVLDECLNATHINLRTGRSLVTPSINGIIIHWPDVTRGFDLRPVVVLQRDELPT